MSERTEEEREKSHLEEDNKTIEREQKTHQIEGNNFLSFLINFHSILRLISDMRLFFSDFTEHPLPFNCGVFSQQLDN